jgi:uncharacterized phage-associated protein
MYTANEIASLFVDKALKDKVYLTHMKLQKLIYIANGISLATQDQPLIGEPIETWDYGPVVNSVYNNYKMFGGSRITVNPFTNLISGIKLTDGAKKVINDAWIVGKDIDGIQLSNWTHNEDSPWTYAKKHELPIIPNDQMKAYFKKFMDQSNG